MLPDLVIKHEGVRQYHELLISNYRNETITREKRQEFAKRIEIIEDLVGIYEYGQEMDYEDLTWTEMGGHMLPEEMREIVKKNKTRYGIVD